MGQTAHRGRLWKMMGKEQYVREMWEYFCRERVKKFREQAEEKKQAGIQGWWQLESPAKEYLEQVKCSDDTARKNDEAGLRRPEKVETGKNTKAFSGMVLWWNKRSI